MHRKSDPPVGVVHPAPDMSNFLAAHTAIRRSNEMLVGGIARTPLGDRRRIRAIMTWFGRYAGELRTHHRNEDEIYFPALAGKVAVFGDYEQALVDDHAGLHDLLDRVEAALPEWVRQPSSSVARDRVQAPVIDLRDLLRDHLEVEDRDILPLFERHITVDELAELDHQMLKTLELKQALFTVPWLMHNVDEQQRRDLWQLATTPLKGIYLLSARSYRRLTTRAFGTR